MVPLVKLLLQGAKVGRLTNSIAARSARYEKDATEIYLKGKKLAKSYENLLKELDVTMRLGEEQI
jgi:hypothetical protein